MLFVRRLLFVFCTLFLWAASPDVQAQPEAQTQTETQAQTQTEADTQAQEHGDPLLNFPLIKKIQEIRDRGVLRVAMHKMDHPPFFMVDETGQLIGIDVELAQELGRQLGVKVEFNRSQPSFNGVVSLVEGKVCDLAISKLSITMIRCEYVLYSRPYLTMNKALLVNRRILTKIPPNITVKELFQEKGFQIGAITNSSYESFAIRLVAADKVYSNPDWNRVIIPEVLEGKLWAAFRDELEVRRTMYNFRDAPLKLIAIILKDQMDPMSICFHKDDDLFRQYVNHFIDVVYGKKTMAEEIKRFDKYIRDDEEGS